LDYEFMIVIFIISFVSSIIGVGIGRKIFYPKEFEVNLEIHQQGESDDEFLEKIKNKIAEALGTELKERE